MGNLKNEPTLMGDWENSFIKKKAKGVFLRVTKATHPIEAVGLLALGCLAFFGLFYGLWSVVFAAPKPLPSAEMLQSGVTTDLLKANALNRREWASAFEDWFMNLRMNDHIVFTTKFLHDGNVALTKHFDEEARTITDAVGGHFEIDFACENRINLKHGSLKYDLAKSHFQVRWGGKHFIDFNDAFDNLPEHEEDNSNEENNSWCTYKNEEEGIFTIRCKTVEHAETDMGQQYTDGFIFEYRAQKNRANDYKAEV